MQGYVAATFNQPNCSTKSTIMKYAIILNARRGQGKSVVLLRALLEGRPIPSIFARMSASLDFSVLRSRLARVYKSAVRSFTPSANILMAAGAAAVGGVASGLQKINFVPVRRCCSNFELSLLQWQTEAHCMPCFIHNCCRVVCSLGRVCSMLWSCH